jgi:hypothetical protein
MATPITTSLSTANVKQIDNFRKALVLMTPRDTPTATFALIAEDQAPISEKAQWGEETALPTSSQINHSAGYLSTDTSFVLDDTTGLQPGSVITIPAYGEKILVGAVAGDGVTISSLTRGYMGTAAHAIADNDLVEFSLPVMDEGFDYTSLNPCMIMADDLYNYVQTFTRKVKVSNTQKAIFANGGVPYQENFDRKIQTATWEIKQDMNTAAVKGVRYKIGAKRYAGGLYFFANDFKDLAAGNLTDRKLVAKNAAIEGFCSYNQRARVACSPTAMTSWSFYAQAANMGDYTGEIVTKAGVAVRKVTLDNGTELELYREPALKDYLVGGKLQGTMAFWAPDALKTATLRPLNATEPKTEGDYDYRIILSEMTFEVLGSKKVAWISGITHPADV